jgi:hypothetical protein
VGIRALPCAWGPRKSNRLSPPRRDPKRWRGGVAGVSTALPHPGAAPSLTPAYPNDHGAPRPSPTVTTKTIPMSLVLVVVVLVHAAGAGVGWCSRTTARCQLTPCQPESTDPSLSLPQCYKCTFQLFQMFQSHVASVS